MKLRDYSRIAILGTALGVTAVGTLIFAPPSHAQVDTGRIAGSVTDSSGAVIAAARVIAHNNNTGLERTATTDNSGLYTLTDIPVGTYTLTFSSSGFSTYKAQVEVTVGSASTIDAKLGVGTNTTEVEVMAAGGTQVNTQTQELSQVVDQQQIANLPSLTRNPYDFVTLSGNISGGDNSSAGNSQNATLRGVNFNINGQRSTGTEILLDGVENISVFGDGVGIKVPIDAVQEFRVATSNFEPQYGRASGGVVNVSTRSGSNNFHGSAWEFNRIAAYTSNTVTNAQAGNPKGGYTRNQFGFAVGGPVLKDKLFFFGSTEWTRVRSNASLNGAVATPQFLALTAPNVQSYFSEYAASNTFSNFTNTYTADYLNTATNGKVSLPGIPGATPVFGTVPFTAPADAGGGLPQNTYNIVGRVDYNLNDKTQAFFRYVDYNEIDQMGAPMPHRMLSTMSVSPSRTRLIY